MLFPLTEPITIKFERSLYQISFLYHIFDNPSYDILEVLDVETDKIMDDDWVSKNYTDLCRQMDKKINEESI